jgi:outer membrane cobalamin receptor
MSRVRVPLVLALSAIMFIVVFIHPRCATAQPSSTDIEPVTVVASKLDVSESDLPQATSILTADEIAAQAQNSMVDTLRQLPAVQFQQAGGPGQSLHVVLRGFSDSTLYVFDGITLNAGGSGDIGYLLGQLDPTMVQRIEVLRGPHATLYGANSTAGVINFTSIEGDHAETNVDASFGSLDWKKLRAGTQNRVALSDGVLSYAANGSWIDSAGINQFEFYKNATLVARGTYQSGEFTFGVSFYGTDNEFQNADLIESIAGATRSNYFAVQIPDPSDVDQTKFGLLSIWLEQQLSAHWSQKLTVGGAGQDFSIHNGDYGNGGLIGYYTAPYDGWTDPVSYLPYAAGQTVPVYQTASSYKTINNNKEADYNLRYRSSSLSAVLGATYLGQLYDEGGAYGSAKENQSTGSLYADALIATPGDRAHLELGARLDHYSAWATKGTYSLGVDYDLSDAVDLYGNYATSFTQPTLDELYNPIYGNKGLTPENASTIEAGVRARELDQRFTQALTYWHSYISNVITYDFSIYNPRNVGNYGEYGNSEAARSQGVELELAYRLAPELLVSANYTHTDSYQTDTARVWHYRTLNARNMGNLAVSYETRRFNVGTNLYLSDHRLRWAGDVWAPGYLRLDVYGRYHIRPRLDAYVRIQNALDAHIVEVLGYRTPGVYVIGGAGYRF